MRVAILTNAFPPLSRGGAGRIAEMQADWLTRHGHEVKVWVPAPFPTDEGRDIVESFLPRTTIPFSKLSKTFAPMRLLFHMEDLAPNLKAVDQIRAWKPDVLLTHNLTGCGWGTPRMLRASGVRWLHVLHDVQMFEPSGQVMYRETYNSLRQAWRKFWAKHRAKTFGIPDAVISPSQWLLDAHRKYGLLANTFAQVLPNPIEIPRGFCENQITEQIKVVYNARLSEDKGILVLLDAWQSLNPRPGRLELISGGPLLAKIKKLEDPSIVVHGQLPHEEAMIAMSGANLFVMPSIIMENQPTVLLEAVAAGINVVASDVGGVRELLQGYGTIVPPGDAPALAKAIQQTLKEQINTQIRDQILARHNFDTVMGELVKGMVPNVIPA
ncbi:MAG: glycosyltransferase family 4 protein [Patescibacteria group bacterium]|nr:glycosyltransferase family 4 protein [Patescibacteria group bacterium]